MSVTEYIDVASLLDPVSEDHPVGVDIREDISPNSIYYKIKDARTAARASERRIIMEDDQDAMGSVVPEWYTVLDLAPSILKEQSKDIEIVAWYVEGLLRVEGFAGLKEGFKLVKELCDRYWDDLFPLPDEDGMETRVAPITGLNGEDGEGTLLAPMRNVLLTQGYTDQAYATWHYQIAQEIERITDAEKRQARLDAGGVTLQQLQRSALETPLSFYETLIADLDNCIEAFAAMTETLDQLAGQDSPPSSNIKNALREIRDIVSFLTRDMFIEEEPLETQGDSVPGGHAATAAGGGGFSLSGDIGSREDAVRVLNKVADYFKRTEPHSPVAYSLEQAIRWSRMSLPELLAQLIPNDSARDEYYRLTGVPRPGESESTAPPSSTGSTAGSQTGVPEFY